MTDKELLESAAKAAGIEDGNWIGDGNYWVGAYDGGCEWNPLTDDGDALRLAVKLEMAYVVDTCLGVTQIESYVLPMSHPYSGMRWCRSITEQHDSDPYAATRRAIVRAAAEIGKEMK